MRTGIIAGNFDLLHIGYVRLFKESKHNCDKLIVFLHIDPSLERPDKHKPIFSLEERIEMISSIKYVDEIITYSTESDLLKLLSEHSPHIRFLGDDYVDKDYTGRDLNNTTIFINRDHGWSTTKLKNIIKSK